MREVHVGRREERRRMGRRERQIFSLRAQQGSSDESDGETNSHGHCKVCMAKSGNSKSKRCNEKIGNGALRFEQQVASAVCSEGVGLLCALH